MSIGTEVRCGVPGHECMVRHNAHRISIFVHDGMETKLCVDFPHSYNYKICDCCFWRDVVDVFCAERAIDPKLVVFFHPNKSQMKGNVSMASLDTIGRFTARLVFGWRLAYDLERLFTTSIAPDVVLVIGALASAPREIAAHKHILGARCDKFRAMFFGKMESPARVELMAAGDETTYRMFVRYLYTDICAIASLSIAQQFDMLHLAEEYLLPRLKKICVNQLIKRFRASSVISSDSFMEMANGVLNDQLQLISLDAYTAGVIMISKHFIHFFHDLDFRKRALQLPHFLLDLAAVSLTGRLLTKSSFDPGDQNTASSIQSLIEFSSSIGNSGQSEDPGRRPLKRARLSQSEELEVAAMSSGDELDELSDDMTAEDLLQRVE